MTIGVSELQKNISIIRNLQETLYVVDKKTQEVLATILPNKKKSPQSITDQLAGSLKGRTLPEKYRGDIDAAIADAFHMEMMEKYGQTHAKPSAS